MPLPIQVPNPCHEDWQKMIPEDNGRHCLSCQKTVVDFTQMTDAEILSFFQQKPAGVCGRFRQEQLTPKLTTETKHLSRWKMYLLAISATLAMKTLLAETTKAQTPVEQREPQIPSLRVGMVAYVHNHQETFTLSGKVTDAETKEALAGVSIVIKGTTQGTVTDARGEFQLPDVKKGSTVSLSFIGYVTEERIIQTQQPLAVSMLKDIQVLGEIRYPLHKRIWYSIQSWFQ